MATVINNPDTSQSGSGVGFLVGVVLLIIAGVLFFYYIVPALRNTAQGPTFQVPNRIDVNYNQSK
jgi:hypothetical protein